jgi:hypothetical protein
MITIHRSFNAKFDLKTRIVHVEALKAKLATFSSRLARPPVPATVPAAPKVQMRCDAKGIIHR